MYSIQLASLPQKYATWEFWLPSKHSRNSSRRFLFVLPLLKDLDEHSLVESAWAAFSNRAIICCRLRTLSRVVTSQPEAVCGSHTVSVPLKLVWPTGCRRTPWAATLLQKLLGYRDIGRGRTYPFRLWIYEYGGLKDYYIKHNHATLLSWE